MWGLLCVPLDTLQTIQSDSVLPKKCWRKTWKSRNGDIFCNLFATPAPASQHKQTNKQCCLFNVQRVFLSFLDLNRKTPCVYSRPVCQFVHLYYMPASLSLKQNPNSPKELQLDCTLIQSSKNSLTGISPKYSWCHKYKIFRRDPSDKQMFLIIKVTSSNFPIMWLCRKVVTANNKTFTFWCWNFPKKFVKLSAKFPLTNRSKEVFKGNYQRNLSVGVRPESKK